MTKNEFSLLIDLALVLREMAPPDSQRKTDRALEKLQEDQYEQEPTR